MYKKSIVLILLLWASAAYAAQPSAEAMYQNARRSFYALLASSEKMKERSNWRVVVNKFRIIATNRPRSSRGDDALYTVGLLYERMYKKFGDPKYKQGAVKSFQKVAARYPKSNLADDARRHIGDISFLEHDAKKAASEYRKAAQTRSSRNRTRSAGGNGSLASLANVKRYSRDGYTRLILYLTDRTAYRVEKIKNPDRVFIDLLDTKLGGGVPKTTRFGSGMASALRIAQNNSSVTRVVLDLSENNTRHTVSSLSNPFRIVIDLGRERASSGVTTPKKKAVKKSGKAAAAFTGYGTTTLRTIVIDAGHGGKDPGAIGPSGLKEKNVTLALSRKVRDALKRRCACRVLLTRNSDRFLELDERTVIANSLNADLFISIHANASRDRRAYGMETYFLSPARSRDEMETAARENMLALNSANEVENDLAYIMTDLNNTRKINDSVSLARSVQRSLVKGTRARYSRIKDKGVKQAMFYVLWRASMPSILVEAGFITNRTEERRLRDRAYISRMAESIADGVMNYSRTYTVARSD